MKTFRKIVHTALLSVLLITCKKEETPPNAVLGQPVFSFNGTINSQNVSLEAGVNNYYMYSSFAQDSVASDSVVYSFIGNLQSTATNKNSIQISIDDYKISVKNTSVARHIDTSFSRLTYYYYKPDNDTTGYNVTFTPKI